MMAWGNGGSASLVAIPADLDGPPVVVAQGGGMVPYDGYPDTTLVPIQTWGRSPNPSPTPRPSVAAPTSADEELLNRFLEARVAGEGAGEFMNDPDEDIPLLYATTSGAPYERAEFERVPGIEWPYGWTAFRVRLFAGDTVVEQLFFTSSDNPMGLEYVPDGFGTDIAPTTEDGQPVARAIRRLRRRGDPADRPPVGLHDRRAGGRLIPEGPGVRRRPTAGSASTGISLVVMADPAPVGTGCPTSPIPADAEALAESIRSDPDLEATAPVPVSAAGRRSPMLDVVIAAGSDVSATRSWDKGSAPPATQVVGGTSLAPGDRMRLYLFDAPEGSSMRILAMAIVVPESRFERAAPALDAVEFHVR